PRPLSERVGAGSPEDTLGKDGCTGRHQLLSQSIHERSTPLLSQRQALLRSGPGASRLRFHGIDLPNKVEQLLGQRIGWTELMGIEQFAPRVRQASGILDARPEFVVGAVAIALQNATKALEEGLRAVAPATHLKVHHHRTPRSAE